MLLALSLVGLIGGMLSGSTLGNRFVGAGLAMATLAFGWLVAAGVAIYLKVLWDERQTPEHHHGPRLVVGRARTGRNVPGSWRV